MGLRQERGQAVVEYAIVFPIQLMITLAVIQLALIFVAKSVVNYSAFCGARAYLVGESPEDAATIPLSAVAGTTGADAEETISLPGWGELPRSGAAKLKTTVTTLDTTDEDGTPVIVCNVDHLYELTVPIGNYITYQLGDMFMSLPDVDTTYGAPHLHITGSSTLVKPWDTSNEVGE